MQDHISDHIYLASCFFFSSYFFLSELDDRQSNSALAQIWDMSPQSRCSISWPTCQRIFEANGLYFDFSTIFFFGWASWSHKAVAAANIFLDAFVSWRIQQGLPVYSVDVSPVESLKELIQCETAPGGLSSSRLRASIRVVEAIFEPLHQFCSHCTPAKTSAAIGAAGSGSSAQ
ncbi:hypothetical protein DE146DRAFT_498050 [Phaeosphaeria sp. MPI-PUGE-AT-0046c]|nr:hypothetical protein DE146DRAFT_498050 [Phaeosphaeria sp. MPI-PUGE-AT-0046c]